MSVPLGGMRRGLLCPAGPQPTAASRRVELFGRRGFLMKI